MTVTYNKTGLLYSTVGVFIISHSFSKH